MIKKSIFLILIFIFIFPTIKADVLAINAGGDEEIAINAGGDIEGFFACFPKTCSQLGSYNCNSWSDGCGGTLNCGTCTSGYTCTAGVCTATGGGDTGGGTGGGGGVTSVPLTVVPRQFNIKLAINTNQKETISVTNDGTSTRTVSISQRDLGGKVILGETSLTLAPEETKTFDVTFVAPDEPGIFTGKILVGGVEVLVVLNIKTKLLLFDSNIVVLNQDYRVSQGGVLKTKVGLLPLGDQERLDVTLNYVIKDYSGKIYLTQSETLLVEERTEFTRNFATGLLPLGEYIVGLELVYPGGLAPSSAHFQILERTPEDTFALIVFILILGIMVVAISIVTLLIIRHRK